MPEEQRQGLEEQPEAVRALVGRTITVTEALTGIPNSRPYLLRVEEAKLTTVEGSDTVWATGDRLRMDGTPARRKRGNRCTVALLGGWTEVLGLPALPPREWRMRAVGLTQYAERARRYIALTEIDQLGTYRHAVVGPDGGEEVIQVLSGDEVVDLVADVLRHDGVTLERHRDDVTLRLRYADGRPAVFLGPVNT